MSSNFSIVLCIVRDSINMNWRTIERRWQDSLTLIVFSPCLIVSLFGFFIFTVDLLNFYILDTIFHLMPPATLLWLILYIKHWRFDYSLWVTITYQGSLSEFQLVLKETKIIWPIRFRACLRKWKLYKVKYINLEREVI